MSEEIIRSPHPATLMVYERLRRLQMDEIVTWDELSEIIGMDARTDGNGFVQTARNKCGRDDGFVFYTVRGVGIQRLTDEDIAKKKVPHHRRLMRRRARKLTADANNADTTKMTPEAQRELTAGMWQAAQLNRMTGLKFTEELKTKASLNEPPPLPPFIVE